MKKAIALILVFLIAFVGCVENRSENASESTLETKTVKLGIEVFLEKHLNLVEGKKVGLVTNPTGVDGKLNSDVDLLYKHPGIELVALYGPEHGVRGNAQAGEYVSYYIDEKYSLPVFSLYGKSRKPDPAMLKNIGEYIRTFDATAGEKILNVDVLIFDIQDVGARIYTYIATMAYCMQTCAEVGIDFIVLDRPNPINGLDMEGPILEYPEYSSFVGLYPIPIRHGMTVGELAELFNDRFFEKKVNLTVIPMENWKREMWYDETALPWVIPSPNMPTLSTATVYPGQVFIEGTEMSEGRGTTKPFELFGAPWIDGYELTKKLNELNLPGVAFREAWFTPIFSKHRGKLCGGSQIYVIDRDEYKPFETTLYIIETTMNMYPDEFEFYEKHFDRLAGNSWVREGLQNNIPVKSIVDRYSNDLETFSSIREPYLIYS